MSASGRIWGTRVSR